MRRRLFSLINAIIVSGTETDTFSAISIFRHDPSYSPLENFHVNIPSLILL